MYDYKHTSNQVAMCLADEALNNLVVKFNPETYLGVYHTRFGLLSSYAIVTAGALKGSYDSEFVQAKMCYEGETRNAFTLSRMLASIIVVRYTEGASGLVYPHRISDLHNGIVGTDWCEAISRVEDAETKRLLRDLYSNNNDGLAGGFKSVALKDLGEKYEDDYAWSKMEYMVASELHYCMKWYGRNLAVGQAVKRPIGYGPNKKIVLVKFKRTSQSEIVVTVKGEIR